jgi:hypothetical protein
MYWLQLLCALWVLAFMVFHANPMNNPLDPQSEMNSFHPMNCRVERSMRKDGWDDALVTPSWPDVAPWFYATLVSVVCLVVYAFVMSIAG